MKFEEIAELGETEFSQARSFVAFDLVPGDRARGLEVLFVADSEEMEGNAALDGKEAVPLLSALAAVCPEWTGLFRAELPGEKCQLGEAAGGLLRESSRNEVIREFRTVFHGMGESYLPEGAALPPTAASILAVFGRSQFSSVHAW